MAVGSVRNADPVRPWIAERPPHPGLRARCLSEGDLERLVALHAHLHDVSPTKGLFVRETDAFFSDHLRKAGQILGLEDTNGGLVAYTVLGVPDPDGTENFGHDLGWSHARRARVFHLDGSGVHPAFRGFGLQKWMTEQRLRQGAKLGRSAALSMAAPANTRSLSNLTEAGLSIVALIKKYGAPRFVLLRDLWDLQSRDADRDSLRMERVATTAPAQAHLSHLKDGWIGRALRIGAQGEAEIVYVKRVKGATEL